MKLGVAIKSCNKYYERQQACRDTWLNCWQDDFVFLLGKMSIQPIGSWLYFKESLQITALDDFKNIAPKVRAACQWAASKKYDALVVCDDDTYIHSQRIAALDIQRNECRAWIRTHGDVSNHFCAYPQGSCMVFGSDVIQILATNTTWLANGIPDDCAIGGALSPFVLNGNIKLVHEPRFWPGPEPTEYPKPGNQMISTHKCNPDGMRWIHQQWN